MKRIILLSLVSLFLGLSGIAQTLIKADKLPAIVNQRFKQKFRRAKEVKWFENNRTYTAKFNNSGTLTETTFDFNGTLIESRKTIELKKLNNKIATDLRKSYKDLDPISATLIEKGRRDKYYSIILHKSQGRKKAPLVYEIQYDFQGKFLTIYEPEIDEEVDADKEDKYDKKLDKEMEDFEEIEYNVDVKKSDLPSKAGNLLKKRFAADYRYRTIRLNENKKYGPHYFVEMRQLGEGVTYQFWFKTNGDLIKEKTVKN